MKIIANQYLNSELNYFLDIPLDEYMDVDTFKNSRFWTEWIKIVIDNDIASFEGGYNTFLKSDGTLVQLREFEELIKQYRKS